MNEIGLVFPKEQFNRLFPFYILINRHLKIESCGNSLSKLCPAMEGKPFEEFFLLKRPALENITFDGLETLVNQLVVIELAGENNIPLRGQFEYLSSANLLLFAGSPWFGSMEQVKGNKLSIHDFAFHDPLIDLLHVLKTQEITTDELKQLLATVSRQRNELRKAAKQIEDMALFPMQNPDPLIRVNARGQILMMNPASEKLLHFTYRNTEFDYVNFWESIVQDIDKTNSRFTFECISEGKVFSFVCVYLKEQDYFNIYGRDVTLQKKADEELKRLSLVASANENGVVFTGPDGIITWANEGFSKLTGYTLTEIYGKTPIELLRGPLTDKATLHQLVDAFGKGESFDIEIVNYRSNGSWFWGRTKGQSVKDENGKILQYFALLEDISLEKEINIRIKESEKRFRLALEKIGDNVWEYDFTTGNTFFSKSNNDFLGIDSGSEELNTLSWWNAVFKDDLPLLEENDRNIRSGKTDAHSLEYRIVRSDGSILWVLDRGVVIEKDQRGLPLRIIGTHTDITHIKQTEIELRNRVIQFKSLSGNIPAVLYEYVFRKDGSQGFSYISPAIEKVFGIEAYRFENNFEQFIHKDDLQRAREKNNLSRDTLQPFSDEIRMVIPGNGIVWNSISSAFSYVAGNGDIVFTGLMKDVTAQKSAAEALRANEEKYRSIIDNMRLGLLEVDTNELIVYANQAFCNMSGYTVDEMIGKEAGTLLLRDEQLEVVRQKNEIRKHGISDAYEISLKDKNGNQKWWLISGAPRYNDNGELVGSIGIHLDITEQKQLEKDLIDSREEARQYARAREEFLANMSHEIRTPMNAIIGMSAQLSKTDLGEKQRFYLDTIHSASDNLLIIINDILDLSKVQAGKLTIENLPFEPFQIIQRSMQVLTHRAEEKGLLLTNSFYDPGIAQVLFGDPYRLNQVLLNLISNAIKFTEKGYVDIACRLLDNNNETQTLEISVKDTGLGMDDHFLAYIFDKFSQEQHNGYSNMVGTGLGMSITKELIELMGGSIEVQSSKGAGSAFFVRIEFLKGLPSDLPAKQPVTVNGDLLNGKTILVADDNEMNRLVAEAVLLNFGANILQANNGLEAIACIRRRLPDLVLMDIQMPELNGYEATTIIRRDLKLELPIIALTANAIKGESEKCIEAGMNDYISKPFSEEQFISTICKYLQRPEMPIGSFEFPANEVPLFSLAKLNEISRGNEAFVQKMTALFKEQAPATVAEIRLAFINGDLDRVKSLAHRLKPSFDNLAISSFTGGIRLIENFNGDCNPGGELESLINELEAVVDKVTAAL